MARHAVRCGVLAASVVLLAGCSTTAAAPSPGASGPGAGQQSGSGLSAPAGGAMRPGMVMPDGSTMPGMVMPDAPAGPPSASAKMICGPETQDNVAKVLALPATPHTTDNWANTLYTCTYYLADGPLVLSVKESADDQAARGYFDALRVTLGSTHSIDGLANLGLSAYQDTAGSVVFIKDNMTLRVDAAQLPDKIGPHSVSRHDLAYEIATAVLACWSGK